MFEPEIIAFCCEYCGYSAADLAGAMRVEYPPNVVIVRVPCAGYLTPVHILRVFEEGYDGVFIASCLEGSCQYRTGNERAEKMVSIVKKLLDEVRIGGERLEIYKMASSMGKYFADIAINMTEKIKKLGPNPIKLIEERFEEEEHKQLKEMGVRISNT